ncbi:DUF3761 domain-containing protein [Streptomyces sp. NPDC007189]|uniref:DUF3761 domain-containing protein n=1 Tax=Streptomyces sp. NPDC007189 TaxID=3154315 RepID=UPI00345476A1
MVVLARTSCRLRCGHRPRRRLLQRPGRVRGGCSGEWCWWTAPKCNDASLSYSRHSQGTCSHHHGVRYWFK